MKKIGAQLDVPLVSNQLHGGKTPILPQTQLKEMGFAAAIYPSAALFAAARTRTNGLQSRAAINLAATTVFPKAVVVSLTK